MLRWVPFVVFLHFLLKFKPFDEFLPNCRSLCVCVARVRVCVLPLNIEVSRSQAIIGTFFQCLFQKMIGWVPLEVLFALCWSLNHLKCDGQYLFLSYCDSCSACEKSFLTRKECAHFRSPRQKCIYIYISVWTWLKVPPDPVRENNANQFLLRMANLLTRLRSRLIQVAHVTSLGCLCPKPASFAIFGCKYVCMYVCMYMYVCVCMYVCMYVNSFFE